MPPKPEDGTPVVVGKAYDFVLWLLPKVEKFPRSHRFTVGERLSSQGLDVLVILTEAAYASSKDELLTQANRKINSTRLLLRLAKDLKLLSLDAYGFAAEKLDEIGRMAGGWRKAAVQRG
ncbi:MAG: diversity-generating retroelement protein Avd [Bryobacteraceae bacterium]